MNTKLMLTLVVLALALAACKNVENGNNDGYQPSVNENLESSQELKSISNVQELRELLAKASIENSYSYGGYYGGRSFGRADVTMAESAAPSAKTGDSTSTAPASDYSKTNVQVEGVDEADFVKNDDKYIYVISGNKLSIVDAFPAENAKTLSEIDFDGNPRNMFVNKNRLIVFVDTLEPIFTIPEYDYMPRESTTSVTHVFVYDITDRTSPKKVHDYSLKGYYFESRMINDNVYFISKENVYYDPVYLALPQIKEGDEIIASPKVFYFDNPEYNYVFHTVASFNVFNEGVNAQSFMLGYSDTLYVSEDNIYWAYQKNYPNRYYQENNQDRFYNVVLPILPESAQEEINSIKSSSSSDYEKWQKISSVLEDMYNNMQEPEKKELTGKIDGAVEEYEFKLQQELSKTVIHKINIENGLISYDAKGEVKGHLLNQFSLDEHEENLRVATTLNIWARGKNILENNVYVLDRNMKQVGALEGIAPEESIFSTRFIGDRLYMVTFQRIDPLFVIDLSNPEKPEILGELKIPGFSDYLHPYDENHIIGVGKETSGNEWGGVSVKGVKISLFDVSDVKNPKQVDQYEIGDSGTDSEALYDHKAFLFDKEKQLLVIPVREVAKWNSKGPYQYRSWQGAYVFTITEKGFELKGKVTHQSDDESLGYYYYSDHKTVRRSLFMDDVLYTVSLSKIKMNSLKDLKEINEVKLPYKQPDYWYGYPVIMEGGVAVK